MNSRCKSRDAAESRRPILASLRPLRAYTCPMNQQAIFERARLSRDSRFDGRFFVGVKTTGNLLPPGVPGGIAQVGKT